VIAYRAMLDVPRELVAHLVLHSQFRW